MKMPDILEKICRRTREDLALRREVRPLSAVRRAALAAAPARDFGAALRAGACVNVIAEVKRASPSAGLIREDFDPVAIARAYEEGGAAAVSVLTDEPFFRGSLKYLEAVRAEIDLPILRKDFILDAYQVYEARAAGADAVLLIVAALPDPELGDLRDEIESLGMAALVEVHDSGELGRALASGATLIGVNNRNLHTFEVDLATTEALAACVPGGCALVGESGITGREDVERLAACGVDAVLVGETLMRADDTAAALREIATVPARRGMRMR